MKKIFCYLFGHDHWDDSGYHYCKRCSAHSYYDGAEHYFNDAVLLRPLWFLRRKIYQFKCDVIHLYRKVFLKENLPF